MASTRKPRNAERAVAAAAGAVLPPERWRGKRVVVGLSGGVDSVVLLHVAKSLKLAPAALHVHHGLSRNADEWARFCARYCRGLGVRLRTVKVKVRRSGKGLEAAAREARRAAFAGARADVLLLAHQLDDQAETVLFNLLRGAGLRGASGMAVETKLGDATVLRPLLDVPREAIVAYARAHELEWIEDESNADEALTRNFLRRSVGPLLASRFPRWRESLARAARHFARREAGAQEALRAWLRESGLRAPSEAKLGEMLRQLGGDGARTAVAHDGVVLRAYRGQLRVERAAPEGKPFPPLAWRGEKRLPVPALGGELVFRRARGKGIAAGCMAPGGLEVRPRGGGERLQPDPKRPRRTLKNLFQEAGVPAWERDRLPLLFSGGHLVWVPGLGVDARFRAPAGELGWLPEWRA